MTDSTEKVKSGTTNILIIAGEASGDLHGANLVREILKINPAVRFFGMGGDMMKEAGVLISYHVRDMAIVGVVEVLSSLSLIRRALKDMTDLMDIIKPDAVVLIDYPGFNLRIAKKAKERGIKVVYYISPQIWAWHKGRIHTIKKFVDKMLVAFPFEVKLYQDVGMDVEFVGHPLLDVVPPARDLKEVRKGLGLKEDDTVIGLLPGSRRREAESLLPEMLRGAAIVAKEVDDAVFAIPVAPTLDKGFISGIIGKAADSDRLRISLFEGRAYDVMAASDAIMISSGTATLEAAIIGTPMVITYRMSPVSYRIAKILVNLDFAGLPNILAGKEIVQELLQGDARGELMAGELLKMLIDADYASAMRGELGRIRSLLGGPGASERAARAITGIIQKQ